MAVNVTYLLGAGASCKAIPVVKAMANGIDNLVLRITKLSESEINRTGIKQLDQKAQSFLIDDLRYLSEKTRFFSSPDTFVKSLYLQKNQQLEIEKVKRILSYYLSLKHFIKEDDNHEVSRHLNLDDRYIPFFASILEAKDKSIKIPDNISIVTWNYDFQIELAINHFTPWIKNLDKVQDYFGSVPANMNSKKTKVIHLNGIAGFHKSRNMAYFNLPVRETNDDDIVFLNQVVDHYKYFSKEYQASDLLTFAWELSDENHNRVAESAKLFALTNILVVIGYSFPFFNREVDSKLFNSLQGNHNAKIYIQDPSIDDNKIKFLRSRFNIEDNISIEGLKDTDQFYLPPEL